MKRLIGFSCFNCLIVSIFLLFIASQSMATIYCVANEANLIAALNEAKNNGADDVIKIQQGTYNGNFVYASTESFGVTVGGGYTALCASRVVDPANTILDGGAAGTVLVLSSPNLPTTFTVQGITLQNGDISIAGGLYALNRGEITLNNNTISNNSKGGVKIKDANTVSLNKNTISANTTGDHGGGIYLENVNTVTLTENIISNNSSDLDGGGIYGGSGIVSLTNNTITNNSARRGGGVRFYGSSEVTFTNNIVNNNSSGQSGGGGVIVTNAGRVTLVNNIINNNISNNAQGGGVSLGGIGTATLTNNIISNNIAEDGPAGGVQISTTRNSGRIYMTNNTISNNSTNEEGGGVKLSLHSESEIANIYNNIMWNNHAVNSGADLYINNDGNNDFLPSIVNLFNNDFDQSSNGTYIKIPFTIDPSNLDNADPLFVDPANGDFHLSLNSPCIDTGTDAGVYDDIDGDTRPHDSGFDIGADEYVAEGEFVDVPSNYWAVEHIYKIFDAGITTGCSIIPLKYCPLRDVSRAAMAVFLERGINGGSFTPPPATGIFDDVPDSFWAADWIEQLYNDGITTGCSQSPLEYCPDRAVNRAAMAVFLLRSKHTSNYTPPLAEGIFDDVPITHWAADWIEQLYNEGITTGCKTNPLSYCPDRAVRRDAMAVFLMRTFGL